MSELDNAQAPIDAILELVRTHNIAADDVAQVTLGILDTAFPIICEPAAIKYAPRSVVDAQFSMPFGAAVVLLFRRASLAEARRISSPWQGSACKDASRFETFPCLWPPSATFYKLL